MQHYVKPESVVLSDFKPRWPSKLLLKIIERDGLIVPILVYKNDNGTFVAANSEQSERVMACEELGFETILIEDEWNEDEL